MPEVLIQIQWYPKLSYTIMMTTKHSQSQLYSTHHLCNKFTILCYLGYHCDTGDTALGLQRPAAEPWSWSPLPFASGKLSVQCSTKCTVLYTSLAWQNTVQGL